MVIYTFMWSSCSSHMNSFSWHHCTIAGLSTLRFPREWIPFPVMATRQAVFLPFTVLTLILLFPPSLKKYLGGIVRLAYGECHHIVQELPLLGSHGDQHSEDLSCSFAGESVFARRWTVSEWLANVCYLSSGVLADSVKFFPLVAAFDFHLCQLKGLLQFVEMVDLFPHFLKS